MPGVARSVESESGRTRPDWWHWAVLAAIVLVGVIVRVDYLAEPMRYDEAFTFNHYAAAPIKTGLSTYDFPNNHLLHTALVHYSWRVFGDEPWALRLPALLAGIALIPAVYVAARAFFDRNAALWAAALTAGSAPLVTYATQARGYSLVVLTAVLALALAPRLARRGSPAGWALFVALAVCTVYAIPSGAYAIAIPVAWIGLTAIWPPRALRDPAERSWRLRTLAWLGGSMAAAGAICLLLYLPTRGETGWGYAEEAARTLDSLLDVARTVLRQWRDDVPLVVGIAVAAAALAASVFHRRVGRTRVPLALAALATLGVIAIAGPISPFARTWLYLLPVVLIVAGAGLWLAIRAATRRLHLPAEASSAALAVVAAVVLGVAVAPGGASEEDPPRSDADLVPFLRAHARPNEPILAEQIVATPLEYYFVKDRFGPLALTVSPEQVRAGRAIVVVPGQGASLATNVVTAGGGRPAGAPRPARKFRYISVWDVPLER